MSTTEFTVNCHIMDRNKPIGFQEPQEFGQKPVRAEPNEPKKVIDVVKMQKTRPTG